MGLAHASCGTQCNSFVLAVATEEEQCHFTDNCSCTTAAMHASDVTTNLLSVFLGAPLRWAGYIRVNNGLHVVVSVAICVCDQLHGQRPHRDEFRVCPDCA